MGDDVCPREVVVHVDTKQSSRTSLQMAERRVPILEARHLRLKDQTGQFCEPPHRHDPSIFLSSTVVNAPLGSRQRLVFSPT
jgi:hypothetical protein